MELNSVEQSNFTRLAGIIYEKELESVPQYARSSGLFKVTNLENHTGTSREFSEIDLNEYARGLDEGDSAYRARVEEGYQKTMYHKRIGSDISITYVMRKYNKYPEVISRLTNLSRQAVNRIDMDLTHRITFCTATSYTDLDGATVDIAVGDGYQLAYTAHTVKGSSDTYRNRLANNPKVSPGALEGMERLVTEETINQFGEKKTIEFDILYYGDDPNTENVIMTLIKSTADPFAPNNGAINVNKGKYRPVKLPRLATDKDGKVDTTKRYYWGLASSMHSSAYLGMWEEPRLLVPRAGANGEDFSSENWTYGVRAGYGICVAGAMWFKFSSGDGTA